VTVTAYDQRAQAMAARVLAIKSAGGKGQQVTLDVTDQGAYDPTTGATGTGSITRQTGSGIEEHFRASQIDGSLIMVGDVRFMLSPLTTDGAVITTAVVDALLEYPDGRKWRVKGAEPFSPAGTLVYTMLHLRRS
jgi:hypothetical protein